MDAATARGKKKNRMRPYLTMDDFSQGLLRVSEERETSVMNSAHSFESISQRWQATDEKVPHSPL